MIEYIYTYLMLAIFIAPILFFFYIQSKVFYVSLVAMAIGYKKTAQTENYRTITMRVRDYDIDEDY